MFSIDDSEKSSLHFYGRYQRVVLDFSTEFWSLKCAEFLFDNDFADGDNKNEETIFPNHKCWNILYGVYQRWCLYGPTK